MLCDSDPTVDLQGVGLVLLGVVGHDHIPVLLEGVEALEDLLDGEGLVVRLDVLGESLLVSQLLGGISNNAGSCDRSDHHQFGEHLSE